MEDLRVGVCVWGVWVCVCGVCVYERMCVFGRGCQFELTIVLFLLICCVTQTRVYLSHKLCICSEKDMKMEAIILLKGKVKTVNSVIVWSLHGSVISYHTEYLWLVGGSAGHCRWLRMKQMSET